MEEVWKVYRELTSTWYITSHASLLTYKYFLQLSQKTTHKKAIGFKAAMIKGMGFTNSHLYNKGKVAG